MAEDDINPNANDVDEEDEEDNEASSAESQRILDELSQFGDGDAPLEDPEDQPDRSFGEDDDNPEPALSQSMSTIHTGSQLTDQEITDGLPPTGQVINPEGGISALEEEPEAEPEFINPDGQEPQYDRNAEPETEFGFEPRQERAPSEPEEVVEAEPEQQPEERAVEADSEEFIAAAPTPPAGPTGPTVAVEPTEATTPTDATQPTTPTEATVPTEVVDPNNPPDALDDAMSGTEDTPITFTAQDLLGNDSDADGDTLSIVSFEQPDNGSITDNGDGTYTFTPNQDWNGETDFNYTISDGEGGEDTATVQITVDGVNDPPVASDDSMSGAEDTPITFSSADLLGNDTDPDGDQLSITSFDQPDNGTITDNGDGTYTFTPNQDWNGETDFNYTITDGNGGTSNATVTIDVDGINDPPVAADDTFQSVDGNPVTFSAQDILGNDSDAEGDALTITGFEQPDDGTITDNGDGTYTFTPDANWDGQTNFNYTITDGNGGTSSATVNITTDGINDPPDAVDDAMSGTEDTPITFTSADLLGNDSDPDGDALTITSFEQPDNGTITDNGDGTYTFTPNQDWNGETDFNYTISDGEGGEDTATVQITVDGVNDPPDAVDDAMTGAEDTPITFTSADILGNDSDPDGDTLTITSFEQPDNGTITDNGDGTYTFTPNQDWNGETDFNYTISDGEGGEDTATVTITVDGVNDPPDAVDDAMSGEEDTPITFTAQDLLGNDSDADGDTLSIVSFEQPDNGSITDNGDGTYTFTPNQDWNGETDFNYTISDGEGGEDTATVTITVDGVPEPTEEADDPTLDTGSVTGAEDTAVPLDISASLTDLDGSETLSLTISNIPDGSSLNYGSGNGDGTWTISADDFASNPDLLDNLTITPPQDYYGDFSLEVSATATETVGGDEASVTSTFGVTVTPVLDAPTLETENVLGTEDNDVELQISAFMDPSTTETVDTLILSGIPEGSVLNKGTDNGDGTWSLSAGEVSGLIMTPPQDYEGNFTVQVTAISTDGGIDVSTFNVDIEGTLDVEGASGSEDEAISLHIDPGAADTITISGVPDGATLIGATDNGDGTYTVTDFENLAIVPPENSDVDFTLSVTADDDEPVQLFVEVDAAADAPTLDLTALATGSEDGAISLDISAAVTDTDGSESLSVTISGVPDGAVLSAGADNGDGTWTISSEDLASDPTLLDNLTITPPDDFAGTFDLGVTATSTEQNGGAMAETTGTITVNVDAVADAADLATQDAAGTEDQAIALNITAASTDVDGSESVSVTISNIPDGAVLTDGAGNEITITGGSADLTTAQLEGLTITPPENSDGDFTLDVAVTTTDGEDTTTVNGQLNVDVAADADAPTLDLTALATGSEDGAISLDISAAVTDTDGSESLSVTISGVPDGAVLSAGADNGDGTWTISSEDLASDPTLLDNLTITPPDDFAGTFDLGVTATSTEQNGGAMAETTGTITVNVDAVADAADLATQDAAGTEDQAIALNITAASTDVDGSESVSVTISNIPDGAVLTDGAGNEITITGGSADLTTAQLEGLTITPPENSDGDFTLDVAVTTTDGEDTTTVNGQLNVDVAADADAPTLDLTAVAGGDEDTAIALDISSALADTDGSETLSITISDIPDGAILTDGAGNPVTITDGSATLEAGQLEGLTVTPPDDFAGTFDLSVTATSTEGDGGDTAQTLGSITVNVDAVADAADLATQDAAGTEDQAIALNITAASTDADGSESVSVTISNIPDGAVLTDGAGNEITITGGSADLTTAQLEGLTITPPENSDGDFTLDVAVTTTDGEDTTTVNGQLNVDVAADADAPTLDLTAVAGGDEDTAIALDISSALADTDGSETLSITISDIPDGAILTDGAGNPVTITDGSATLEAGQLEGLTVTPPDDFAGTFDLSVTATSTEGDGGDTAQTLGSITVNVDGIADGATVDLVDASGFEDTVIPLDIDVTAGDSSEAVSISIDGIPDGAQLTYVDGNGATQVIEITGGSVELTSEQLNGLSITPPENSDGDFPLEVSVTTTDGDSTSTTTNTLNVAVEAVADDPTLTVSDVAGQEDSAIELDISSALTDADGSETLSITISDIPNGSTLTTASGTVINISEGVAQIDPADLSGLQITPPTDYTGSFDLNVTATSTEAENSDTAGVTQSATITVNVDNTNDGPVAGDDALSGTEDGTITFTAADLLGNDSDVDGDALSITGFDQPEHGAIVDNGDGTFTFTPDADWNGATDFTYTVSDGQGGTDTATVSITVDGVNDGPVAGDDALSGTEDGTITFTAADLLGNDSDVDGDALSITGFDQPEHGAIVDNGDGTFTFTPDADWNGATDFTYTVSDGQGGTDTATVSITVDGVNDGPVAGDDALSGTEDGTITFTAADLLGNDSDVDGDALSITGFDQPEHGAIVDNGDGTFTFTPDADWNGATDFTYTVSDGQGGTDTATVSITVDGVNDGPVAGDDALSGTEDGTITFTAADLLGNDSDVDGDALSITGFDQPEHGAIVDNGDGTFTFTPDADWNGATDFTYTVSDGQGGTDTATVSITVDGVNDGPVAGDDALSGTEDGTITFTAADLLGNDSDVDGDALSITGFDQPEHGAIVDNGDGTFTFTPDADWNGATDFTYTVSDGQGGEDTATVSITVDGVNDGPVAGDDALSGTEDGTITFTAADLLGNDSDVDGDALSITGFDQPEHGAIVDNGDGTFTFTPDADWNGATDFTYTVSDGQGGTDTATVSITVDGVNDGPVAGDDALSGTEDGTITFTAADLLGNDSDVDGDALSITGFDQPEHGAIVDNGDGTFTFTPDADWNGATDFTYTVSDGQGGTDTATVSITVDGVNDGPVAGDDALSGTEDGTITFTAADLLGNDSDVDGDALSITGFDQPEHGAIVDNGDGTFTFTPDADWNGATDFTYTVSDGQGGTDTATVSITVDGVNDGPVAGDDALSGTEDGTITFTAADLLGNDSDVDGDALSITGFDQPEHGAIVDNGDGTFTFTPDADWNGATDFTYTVSDGQGGTDTATVSITVDGVNDGPVAGDDALSGTEDGTITFTAADLLGNDSDVDGDALSITGFDQPEHGAIVDNGDGTFTFTPDADWNGATDFTYTVSDGQGGTDTATVSITVDGVNDGPVAGDDALSGTEDGTITFTAADLLGNDSDVDGDALSITGFDQPEHGAIVDNGDGTFTFTPDADWNGATDFTYTVSDGQGGTDTATVSITVDGVNDGPVAGDDALSGTEDGTITFTAADLLGNDSDVDGDALSITGFDQPEHGAIVDNGDGTFTFTPDADWNGATDFTYTVSDGQGGTDTATVSITVDGVNDGPVAGDDALSGTEDGTITFTAADLLGNDSDVDGDALSITGFDQPEHGAIVDNGDGTFTFTPDADWNGATDFTYTVSDGQGGEDTATVSITVDGVNDGPVAGDDALSGTEDGTITFTAADLLGNDSDVDGDALSITGFDQPEHGAIVDNGDGTFTFTPDADWNGATDFTYTVSDGQGGTDTATVSITVDGVNDGPVAGDDALSGTEDGTITFTAADLLGNDSDVDGDALSITGFDQPEHGAIVDNGDGTFTFTPDADWNGATDFTYTVSDGQGGTDTATVSITVDGVNDGPVAGDDALSGTEDGTITFTAADLLGNDSDVDGDALSITGFDQPEHGAIVDNGDGTFTFTPDADWNGATDFTYTVSDGQGGTDTATVSITVDGVNDGPVAGDDALSGTEDGTITFTAADLLGNDSDVDGDALSITGFDQPEHGAIVDNGDGTFTFTPDADWNGATDFTYTVSDGQGGEDTATVSITVDGVNDGPVAGDDALSGTEDGTITFTAADLLGNDSDVDGDALSITGFDQPEHGAIVDNGDGTFTFTPDADWNGATDFTYTVSDGQGGTDTATVSITVDGVNDGPVAGDDALSGTEDGTITFTAADLLGNDSDVDGDALSITGFDQPEHGAIVDNGDGTFTFTPDADWNGATDFTYTVSDGQGGTDTATVSITVDGVNDGPVAGDDALSGTEDGTITFTAADLLGNDSDVDGDALSITGFDQPEHGAIVDNGDGTFTFTPDADWNGATDFTYTVSDGQGGTDTATVSITVDGVNDGPVAGDDALSGTEDGTITFTAADLLGNDSDVDGDALSITGFDQPEHGAIVDNGDGTFTFTPDADWNGATDFTYTVSDGQGGTDTATVSITVDGVNDGPVAGDDALSGTEDGTITFTAADLLGNDSDVDGDALSITGFDQPEHGAIVDNGDGTFTFTPDADWNGATDFTYTVSDGQGGTDTATVSITVDGVNDGPVAGDDALSGTEDGTITFTAADLLGNDSDVDGDALSITGFDQPEHGAIVDNGDGTFTFTPDADWNGATDFTYTVSDGQGGTDTATVSITVDGVNDGPVAGDDALSGTEDGTITFTAADLLGNDSDVDGDALSITGFDQPEHGAIVDNGDGTFTFTPDADWNGATDFTYTVSDGQGGTDTATVSITVDGVNDGPVAGDDALSGTEDGTITFTAADLLGNDSDVDGDALSITGFDQPEHGAIVDNGDGTFTFTPDADWNGATDFTYTVSDGQGGTDTATVSITVDGVNDGPVAGDDALSGTEDGTITFTAADLLGNDSDVDGDALSITGFDQPEHGAIVDNGDGTFTFTPDADWNGATDFTYTVSDGQGGTDTATVSITVDGVNDGPVAGDDALSGTEDGTITFTAADLLGNDSDVDGDALSITGFDQPEHGAIVDNGDGTFTFTPDADWNGATDFTYTVSDGQGGTDTATVSITVDGVNDGPVAGDDALSGTEDGTITFTAADLLGNDSDVDGDALSITGFDQPEHGAIVDNGDGTFTFTPDADWNGATDFTYTVSDGQGGTDTATVSITVDGVNDGPVAGDDALSGTEDGTITFTAADLLGNDSDVDGDALSITGFDQPEHGAIVDNGDGTFTFTPDADWNGATDFTYTVSDGQGGTDTATVSITVDGVNDGPVAGDDALSGTEDGTITFTAADLLGNDSDVDGDALSITGFDQPEHGAIVDNGDGTFTFTPDADWNGATDFTYTVSDGQGGTDTATVSITVDGVVDEADLSVADTTGSEDTAIALDIDVSSVDDISSITITDVPDGAVLSAGTDNGNGTWTLEEGDLEGLTVTPADDSNTDFTLGVSVTTEENGQTVTVDGTIDVDVTGVADAPTLSVDLGEPQVTYNEIPGSWDDMETTGLGTTTSGDDTMILDGMPMNQNISLQAGDDLLVINGDTAGGNNISMGAGGDQVVFNGNIGGNTSVSGASGQDTVMMGKPSSSYQVNNLTNNNGQISAQIVDLDTGETLTVNNIEAIAFGDGEVIGNEDIVQWPDSSSETVVTYDLDISSGLTDTDGSESLSITVDGLPDGALLSAGTQNPDGSWTLESGDLDDLQITLTGDDAGQTFDLSVSATSTENDGDTSTVTQTISSTGTETDATAEGATIDAVDAAGAEDAAIALDIDVTQLDTDGSESLTVTISDIPDGAILTDGSGNEITISGGSAEVSADQLEGLTITPPENSDGDFDLTITATTVEESTGDTSTTTSTLSVSVEADADAPVITANDATGNEDSAVSLDIGAALQDTDGSETLSVTISDIPDGAVLMDASGNEITVTDGAADVSADQLEGLMITPPDNFNGSFDLTITATSTEDANGDSATTTSSITVDVDSINDGPVAGDDALSGTEDGTITFTAADLLGNDSDVDGDALSITGFDQPEHGAIVDNGDGTFTFTPDADWNGATDFTYTVSDGQGGTDTATVSITVDGVVDEADLSVADTTGSEDTAIALDIDVSSVDDISSITITDVPDGAVLSAGTDNGNGTWTLEEGDLEGLTVTPADDSNTDFTLGVSVTTEENGQTVTVDGTIDVDVTGVADAPTLTAELGAPTVTQTEGEQVEVTIDSSNYNSTDAGFNIGGRTINPDGTLSDASTENLSYNQSPGGFGVSGNASGASSELGYNAGDDVSEEIVVSFDDDVSSADVSFAWMSSSEHATYEVYRDGVKVGEGEVTGVTDNVDSAVTLTADDGGSFDQIVFSAPGQDDDYLIHSISYETTVGGETSVEYPLDISTNLNDIDGSESLSITIDDLPDGAALSAGTQNEDGSWTVDAGDLEGLTVTLSGDNAFDGFDFTVSATSTEDDGDTSTVTLSLSAEDIDVSVDGATINASDASGNEDAAIALDIDVTQLDVDGSESLTITISDIPEGAVLTDGSGNVITISEGSAEVSADQLEGLNIKPPVDSNEDFSLTITTTSTEESTGETSTSTASIDVDVVGVADAPQLSASIGDGEVTGGSTDVSVSQSTLDAADTEGATVTVSGVPEGASLSGGTDNGDGTWSLDAGDLDGLNVTPAEGSEGSDVSLTISVEGPGDAGETLVSEQFTSGASGWGNEVGCSNGTMNIGKDETATKTFDFGEEHAGQTVTISFDTQDFGGWDEGGSYADYFQLSLNGDQVVNSSSDSDNSYSFEVTLDENGQVQVDMHVDATASGEGMAIDNFQIETGDDWNTTLATETVDVDLDPPMISFDLDIDSSLSDEDGSETLTITVDNLPDGAVLLDGGGNEITVTGGSADLASGQLDGLSVQVPIGTDDFDLAVSATATESDGDTNTVSTMLSVDVPDVDLYAEGATITESDVSGFEDAAIALDIGIDMVDSDGSETLSVTISDIPDGAVLLDGDGNEISISGGSAEVTQDQLEGLTITPPADSNDNFDLTITATTTETSTGDTATSTATLSVDVAGIADEPTVSVELGEGTTSGGNPTPVAYWNMDETSGLTMNDQIGDHDGHSIGEAYSKYDLDMDDSTNIHHSGAHSGVSAELNTAAEFKDNDGQYIEVPHSADLKPASGSLTLWFNSDESNDGTLASSDSYGYDDGGHFNLSINSSGQLELRMQDTSSSHTISGGDVDSGEWNQVTVTWGEGGMKIFQNGELVASDPSYTGGLEGNQNPWTFGASQMWSGDNEASNMGDFFDGHIDDIAVYDQPLTDEQVQDLYELGVEDMMDASGGGDEIITYPVNITTNLADVDGSESLSVSLTDLPDGAVLLDSDGNEITGTDGEFSLTGDQMDGLQISVPSDTGDFAFTVSATSTEDDGSTNTVTTIAGIDDSSSDTSFEQLDNGGDTWDNDASSQSEDVILGGDGDDDIYTGGGDDTIDGGDGNDYISGEDGDDVMYGGAGDDTLIGGDGNDIMEGGAGDDVALGGQGDDLFIFGAGDGADYFDGGNGWSDTIQLDGVDGGPGGDSGWTMQLDDGATYTESEDGIVFDSEASGKIELADGSELTFEGVEKLEW
ncbi:cadherin-like domain-containing protein [Thalassospiraceae bacterium LMO-JJ14]|nr:cadherin-like domain-containing protein [Thalassospiraceae bacterium LMO-JJ14]